MQVDYSNDFYPKIPFYMTYPMQNTVFEEMEYEKDCKRLQEMYPRDARRIQSMVDEECDRMEYDGSMMYDEYPDRLQLRLMCRRIYDKAEKEENDPGTWLMDLIEVMTYQELCRRRAEHRDIRKKIY